MQHINSKMLMFHSHIAYGKENNTPCSVHGFSMDDYYKILQEIVSEDEPETINPLTYIGRTFPDLKLVASKWNCGHAYAPKFVKSVNCYWLEIIRNPRDRFISSRLAHRDSLFRAIRMSSSNLKFVSSFKHPRYKVVRYEEFCGDSDKFVEGISDWIGLEIKNVQLKNPYGLPSKPNTSKNVTEGREFYYQDTLQSSAINTIEQEWKRNYISAVEEQIIAKGIGDNAYYDLTTYGIRCEIQASLRMMMNNLLLCVRRFLRGILGALRRCLPTL